ncbi:MAG: D-alanine--D-alanine ligase family protein [Acidobacteriota bacterium]
MNKLRIAVLFGGRSGEHEVSVRSASSVLAELDRERYEPIAVYIDPEGRWRLPNRQPAASTDAEAREYVREQARTSRREQEVLIPVRPGAEQTLVVASRGREPADDQTELLATQGIHVDLVFPVLHGPYGEDGTVQGLLELAGVPYVGAGVLASAVCMDKVLTKTVFQAHGLPTPAFEVVWAWDWATNRGKILKRLKSRFALPVFVKPANLGSSVGISKARDIAALEAAVDLAAQYDRKVLVEEAVPHAREIEVSVLGNDEPQASVPGEIVPAEGCDFYDYDAKYLLDSALFVPAQLGRRQVAEAQKLAIRAYAAVDCSGMARVDFLFDAGAGTWFVSELNTIPGFTTISMYPKLWAASGVPYPELLDRLVALALERHAWRQRLRTTTGS